MDERRNDLHGYNYATANNRVCNFHLSASESKNVPRNKPDDH